MDKSLFPSLNYNGMKKIFLLVFCFYTVSAFSQDRGVDNEILGFPEKFVSKIDRKAKKMDNKILKFANKSFKKFKNLERELETKLQEKDSILAKGLFNDKNDLSGIFQNDFFLGRKNNSISSGYISFIDSIASSLNFISDTKNVFSMSEGHVDQLNKAKESISAVKEQLLNAAEIEKMILVRKNSLNEKLRNHDMGKELSKYQKQLHYYSARIKEYKSLLQEPCRIERETLKQLNKLPAFQRFMKENSQLAQIFRLPEGYGDPSDLKGLQGRIEVINIIHSRSASYSMNNFGNFQTINKELKKSLQNIEEKFKDLGVFNNETDFPDFKPNSEKTKLFFRRIEYGLNIQSVKRNSFLPATTDIAATAGYKLNQRSIIGIGISYKIGWGENFWKLSLSHQGLGLRSFIDYQLKGNLYLTGGYEKNYRSTFKDIENLKDLDRWQQSALIGLMKKYKIKSGFKGNVQILFDFFHKENPPFNSPLIFRMGYNF